MKATHSACFIRHQLLWCLRHLMLAFWLLEAKNRDTKILVTGLLCLLIQMLSLLPSNIGKLKHEVNTMLSKRATVLMPWYPTNVSRIWPVRFFSYLLLHMHAHTHTCLKQTCYLLPSCAFSLDGSRHHNTKGSNLEKHATTSKAKNGHITPSGIP